MRVDKTAVENFLSFRELDWSEIDPRLNLIVGPNGVGKSNLFAALRMVVDALGYERRPLGEQAAHRGSTNSAFRVSVDIEFTGEWEKKLLCTYIGAAFLTDFCKNVEPKVPTTE